MNTAWISNAPAGSEQGGGATYNRTVKRLLERVPGIGETIEIALSPEPSRLPHRARQALALLRSALSSAPSKALFQTPAGAVQRLRERLAELTPDLAVISSADLLLCRGALGGTPYVLVAHNVEQVLFEKQVSEASRRFPPAAWFLRRDLEKLRRMETEGARHASLVIAISTEDALVLEGLGAPAPVFVLPPVFAGPFPSFDRPAPARPLRLALVAKMSWWPNRHGCAWFIEEVLSRLPPGMAELHLYGPGSDSMQDPAVHVHGHGFVDDLAEVWRGNHVAICPVHQGSGVNVKFAEAVFNGMPVLATRFGARGLPSLEEDPAIHLLDSADEWVEFLRSADAEELARRTPREETRKLFSDEPYVRPLTEALGR